MANDLSTTRREFLKLVVAGSAGLVALAAGGVGPIAAFRLRPLGSHLAMLLRAS